MPWLVTLDQLAIKIVHKVEQNFCHLCSLNDWWVSAKLVKVYICNQKETTKWPLKEAAVLKKDLKWTGLVTEIHFVIS